MVGFRGFFWVLWWLDFVGQWWCGYVGGDLCLGFWLIWVFGSGCGWLFLVGSIVVVCVIDRFVWCFFFWVVIVVYYS